jgi:hypothetical protein
VTEHVRDFIASGLLAFGDSKCSFNTNVDTWFFATGAFVRPMHLFTISTTERMDDQESQHSTAESGNCRSFRILGAFDMAKSPVVDRSTLLNNGRFLISASSGRVSQVGTRAGSMLYQRLKGQESIRLPYKTGVLAEETTRGSRQKRYAYEVTLSSLPIEKRASERMSFQGSYKTTALKMKVEDFYRAMHRAKRRTRGRMISFTDDDANSRGTGKQSRFA